ncbi:FMN-binding negative transcriptional regulator [Aquincola sp. S2]|uniref:FMN-binding negative transcriptional regulator n=1 Tax=Pseudaquabacterium terrae TaxID=2732868 RepID=A0ABX2EF90_9BURK|nr:FMN-binding negative transcriptional regulator [Aquabacterium terrae]NRF67279.1 FMN-binding negative transcriptional regulator [Aquabacterium terrae]
MNTPDIFRPTADSEIDRLVAAYPLALVISAADGDLQASPLPLVLQRDSAGPGVLIGHFSRFNPQLALVRREQRALVAFSGAQGYISSSWLRERKYAPTWNYQAVHFKVAITLDDRASAAREALETLIRHADGPYPNPWQIDEMGPRFDQLVTAIVPFKATILDTQVQFKLGQGDPDSVLEDGIAGLTRYGQLALANAMLRHHGMAQQATSTLSAPPSSTTPD